MIQPVSEKVHKLNISIIKEKQDEDSVANEIIENMSFSKENIETDKVTEEVMTEKSGRLSSCRSNMKSARSSKGFVSGSNTYRDEEVPAEKSIDSYNLDDRNTDQLPNFQGNEMVRTAFTRAGKMSIVFDDKNERLRTAGPPGEAKGTAGPVEFTQRLFAYSTLRNVAANFENMEV